MSIEYRVSSTEGILKYLLECLENRHTASLKQKLAPTHDQLTTSART
jgi:hypothetical protein